MLPELSTLIEIGVMFLKVFIIANALFLAPIPLTWIERKLAGRIQQRIGPYRVGPHGLLQPIADMIKMFVKEGIVPDKADKFLFKLAPILAMVPIFAVFVVVPFGDNITIPYIKYELTMYVTDMNVGVIYVLAISGLAIYGMIFGGWASNSKYAMLGGMRSAAQMISYEVAMSFAVVGVVMLSGSLSLVDIVTSQSGGFLNWNILYLPVGPLWFLIFIIAGVAEMGRIPFDLAEDEGALAAGYHTEFSAMRFAFLSLAEYVAMISISVLAVVFFLGGWDNPLGSLIPILDYVPPIFWFLGKVGAFIYFFMWLRFTIPRYRYDQLMTIGWKILIPLALLNVLATGVIKIYADYRITDILEMAGIKLW